MHNTCDAPQLDECAEDDTDTWRSDIDARIAGYITCIPKKHHTSPESATASMGAVAWSSSDDLSRHSFIEGSDTSDFRGHKKTKRLKITDTKEVV